MKDSEGLRSVLLRMERLGGRPGHPTSPSALAILSKNREAHVHKFELKVSSDLDPIPGLLLFRSVWDCLLPSYFLYSS